MSASEAGFLIAGLVTGFFIAVVFASNKWWELYTQSRRLEHEVRALKDEVTHLEQSVYPVRWDDENEVDQHITKDKLYKKYPDIVQSGQEVIRITTNDDIPDVEPGWRNKTGQGDET